MTLCLFSEWQNMTNGDLRKHNSSTEDSPPSTNGDFMESKFSIKQEKDNSKIKRNNNIKVIYFYSFYIRR